MAPAALAAAESPSPSAADRRRLTRCHAGDRWRATTTAGALACPPHATSPRALTSAPDTVPVGQPDTSPPRPAPEATAATPPDVPVGGQVPVFSVLDECGRADVQHPCGLATTAGMHRHLNDVLRDVRRVTGVGIL